MRVISKSRLKAFWEEHPNAASSLQAWHQVASAAAWRSPRDVRQTYPSADVVARLTVFNIGGNSSRLITRIEYERQEIYIRAVLTHAEYDKEDWKRDPWFQ
jgi:mRNA interferase HigB